PVLEQLQQLDVEVDHSGRVQAVDVAQRGEVHLEPLPVVVRPEIVQAGVGAGPGVQRVRVQRTVGGHPGHGVEDEPGFGAEPRYVQVVETNVGHADLCYSRFRNGR